MKWNPLGEWWLDLGCATGVVCLMAIVVAWTIKFIVGMFS